MNSKNSPLSFYFDMLFVNSIKLLKDTFIGNTTLQKNGYSYIQEYDYFMKEEMVADDGNMPIFVTDIIKRNNFLDKLLNFENSIIYKKIQYEILELTIEGEKTTYLTNVYNDIQVLLKRVTKLGDEDVNLIEEKLIEIIKNLKDRYSQIITYHNVFKYIINESDTTFFKNKDLKLTFYQDLYEMAYTLFLIDDVEINEQDFIEAFISPTPMLLENKVRFIESNYIVAYFFESLKPFFNGFTHTAIEKSGVFLNKQNKVFKSTDIYASLSRGKGKNENEKSKINKYISKLKEEYLK